MIGKLKGIDRRDRRRGAGARRRRRRLSRRRLGAHACARCRRSAKPATLLIETHVREDAIRLYGFLTASERDWFRLLQSVQGVGAKVALGVLGTLSGDAISAAIAHQDKAAMALAPGVGPKLAARIVHELKDKAPALRRRRSRRRDRRRARWRNCRKRGRGAVLALVGARLRPAAGIDCRRQGRRGAGRRGADRGADQGGAEGVGAVTCFTIWPSIAGG